jgi:hypothetical protein
MSIEILAGVQQVSGRILSPYADEVCDFLDAWSQALRKDAEAKTYTDVMTFAFWCRKASVMQMKKAYEESENCYRIGKGMIFHVAPSNVPVNAAFSYAFGLLAGNSNVVRISTKKHLQVLCLCRVLSKVLQNEAYAGIREMTSFVTYGHEEAVTKQYSGECAMRVIWGGDKTIEAIRQIPLSPRSTEITFADRYSFAIVDGEYILGLSDEELERLAEKFYNDTYLMDQNACSTPHLLFWKNASPEAKNRFWQKVYRKSENYDLADVKVSEKYTMLCEKLADMPEIERVCRYGNRLYVLNMEKSRMKLNAGVCYRGIYGLFFQTDIDCVDDIFSFLDERVQTCALAGVNPEEVVSGMEKFQCHGIDRIVSFGQTLDIGVFWDGYDLIRSMSRCVSVMEQR